MTKLDYDILSGNIEQRFEKSSNGRADEKHVNGEARLNCLNSWKTANVYDKLLSDSQHRWNNVIERSLSFSHFVTAIILKSEQPEQMINKWICIAEELKSSLGNFFSFCSIMRGLLRPQITRSDGKINWLRLRQEHTCSAFSFETTMRGAYQGVIKGKGRHFLMNACIIFLILRLIMFLLFCRHRLISAQYNNTRTFYYGSYLGRLLGDCSTFVRHR